MLSVVVLETFTVVRISKLNSTHLLLIFPSVKSSRFKELVTCGNLSSLL